MARLTAGLEPSNERMVFVGPCICCVINLPGCVGATILFLQHLGNVGNHGGLEVKPKLDYV